MVCARTGVVVHSHVSAAKGKGTAETTAFRSMIEGLSPGTLIVGDAIYEDYFTWALLERAGCSAIFELHGRRLLQNVDRQQLTLERPRRPSWMTKQEYETIPRQIELRIVVCTHPTCSDKYLVISLVEEKCHTDAQILAEFAKRWDIEVDFRSLKDTLYAGILGC